jgi:radical SAM protein with 4Fe4S-binding SPASM domain
MAQGASKQENKGSVPLPSFAWIALTNRCNLNCSHCQRGVLKEQGLLRNREMSWDVFNRLETEVFPHLKRIQFGGSNFGEQLLASKWDDIFKKVRKRNMRMVIVTNGTLLSKERARAMVAAGMEFNFSLEGARKESYEAVRGQGFDKFIDIIRGTCREKIKNPESGAQISLGFTIFRDNIQQLPDLVRMASEFGVDRIIVTHFCPWQEGQRNLSLVYHKELSNQVLARARILAGELGITLYLPRPFEIHHDENSQAPLSDGTRKPCYHPWKSFSINENGDVMPCCATSAVMGNLEKSSFSEIWNGSKYRRLRRTVNSSRPMVFCRNCAFREIEAESNKPVSFWSDEKFLLGAIGTEAHNSASFRTLRNIKYLLMATGWGRIVLPHMMYLYRRHGAFYVTDVYENLLTSLARRLSGKS